MMRTPLFMLSGLLLMGAGCATWRSEHAPAYALDDEDMALAGALARYAQGLVIDSQIGRGQSAEALEAYRKAAQLDPKSRSIRGALVSGLIQQGEKEAALELLRDAVKNNPEDFSVHAELGRLAELLEHFNEAEAAYKRAEALAESDQQLELRLARVRCRFAAKRDAEAIALLHTLPDMIPDVPARAFALRWVQAFAQREEHGRAADIIALLLERTESLEARAQLFALQGDLLENAARPDDAEQAYRDALEIDPTLVNASIRLAVLLHGEDSAQAIIMLEEALASASDSVPLLTALASMLYAEGNVDAAVARLDVARSVLRESDRTPSLDFYAFYSHVLVEKQDIEAATSVFEDGLEHHPENPLLENNLAYMWAEQGLNLERALKLARRAVSHEPDNGAYLDTLGWVYYKQGRFNAALRYLARAQAAQPDDPVVLDHKGDVLAELDRIPEALAFWSRSYALDSKPEVADKLIRHGVDPRTLTGDAIIPDAKVDPGEAPGDIQPLVPAEPES